jgi:hypothetical protein
MPWAFSCRGEPLWPSRLVFARAGARLGGLPTHSPDVEGPTANSGLPAGKVRICRGNPWKCRRSEARDLCYIGCGMRPTRRATPVPRMRDCAFCFWVTGVGQPCGTARLPTRQKPQVWKARPALQLRKDRSGRLPSERKFVRLVRQSSRKGVEGCLFRIA